MDPESVTHLLRRIEDGEAQAREQLVSEVYSELHSMACHCLNKERKEHTLQPTALVNEVYLKVFKDMSDMRLEGRQHLMRTAAKAMRLLLVDHARARNSDKRGGQWKREGLDQIVDYYGERGIQMIDLGEALEELGQMDSGLAQVVDLKFFGGHTNQETGEILGMSKRRVELAWNTCQAWLRHRLGAGYDNAPEN